MTTPLERAPRTLAVYAGSDDLWLKREDVHELGAFKWRAALPVVSSFVADRHAAVVTSSTGNHGAAVAWSCRQLGATAIVFVPPGGAERKLALLAELGADVRIAGNDLDEAKEVARGFADAAGLPFFEDGAEPLQYEAYGAIAEEILDRVVAVAWSPRSVTARSQEESAPCFADVHRTFGTSASSPPRCR